MSAASRYTVGGPDDIDSLEDFNLLFQIQPSTKTDSHIQNLVYEMWNPIFKTIWFISDILKLYHCM